MAYGLLTIPRYRDADFGNIHSKAPLEIKSLCKKFLQLPKEQFYKEAFSFYLYGSYRVGKTWVLHAIANYLIKSFKERSLWYIESPRLNGYFIHGTKREEDDSTWVNFLASRRVLFIDDLGQEYRGSGSGFAETKIENLLRWRWGHGKITYVVGNGDVEALKKIYGPSFAEFIGGEFVQYEVDSEVNISQIILEAKLRAKH